jgi:hypothetical protein
MTLLLQASYEQTHCHRKILAGIYRPLARIAARRRFRLEFAASYQEAEPSFLTAVGLLVVSVPGAP